MAFWGSIFAVPARDEGYGGRNTRRSSRSGRHCCASSRRCSGASNRNRWTGWWNSSTRYCADGLATLRSDTRAGALASSKTEDPTLYACLLRSAGEASIPSEELAMNAVIARGFCVENDEGRSFGRRFGVRSAEPRRFRFCSDTSPAQMQQSSADCVEVGQRRGDFQTVQVLGEAPVTDFSGSRTLA